MADHTSELVTIIEDRLPTTFRKATPSTFPLLEKADRTVMGVKATDGDPSQISRLYSVKHGWDIGSAGMLRSANPYGPAAFDVGTELRVGNAYRAEADMSPIPSAGQSPYPGDFVRTLYLHANVGNVGLPVSWRFSDTLSALKLKMIARIIKTTAEKTRRQDAVSYSSYRATNSSTYKTTVLSRGLSFTAATHAIRAGTTNSNFVDIVLDENYGPIANFHEGDEIDVVANSGGAVGTAGTLQAGVAKDGSDIRNYEGGDTYVQLIVTKVDRITNTITVIGIKRGSSDLATAETDSVATYGGTHGWTTNQAAPPVAYDWICPRGASTYIAGTRPWLTNGLEDWIADSGYIMGGAQYSQALDLAEYPMFKSLVIDNLGGPMDERTLNSLCGVAAERFPNVDINAFITTRGVLLGFKEELETSGTSSTKWERTNMPFKVKGGWTVADYVTPEGTKEWWTSPYCLKGTMYAQQLDPSNLKLYSHKIIGSTEADFAEGIQFLGPLLGYPSAVVPETGANGTPTMTPGMPWIRFALLCPIMPNGWKVSGISEAQMLDILG